MMSLEFFIDIILPIALWPWFRLSLLPGGFPGGKRGPCVKLTILPPSCAVVMKSGNLNFLELSGPFHAGKGLLYLYLILPSILHLSIENCLPKAHEDSRSHLFVIFVVPCIMLNSEINPTRCNNCIYSSQWLYSTCTCFGWKFHPSSGEHMLYMASGRQVYLCCNFVSIIVVLSL